MYPAGNFSALRLPLVERFRLHAVQRGDVAVKQHLLIADREHAGLRIMLKRKAPLAVLVAFGSVGDADARGGGELDARAVAFKPEAIGANEVFAVERAVDLEKLRQPSGAFRAFNAADEHRLWTPFRPRHDVQHFVHPVAEIDVGAAARRIHHVRPRRAPFVRMAGRVLLAAVRLRLGDAPPNDSAVVEPTAKPCADEHLRASHRINRIILCRQSTHFGFLTGFTGLTGLAVCLARGRCKFQSAARQSHRHQKKYSHKNSGQIR